MKSSPSTPRDIDAYIATFPADVQEMLQAVRETIRKAAPEAEEAIKYNIACFVRDGDLVYFAAFKRHIGFYPRASGIQKFKKELSVYKGAKGSVQFPLDQPMPLDLIRKIVIFRMKENQERAAAKKKRR